MADLVLIPQSEYRALSEELKAELPRSLKVISLLQRYQTSNEIKCYARMIGTKIDSKMVVIKQIDERFQKFDLEQDFTVFCNSFEQINKMLENKTVMDSNKVILFRDITDDLLSSYVAASRRHAGKLQVLDTAYILYQLLDEKKLVKNFPSDVELGAITEESHEYMMRVSWLYRELVAPEEFHRLMLSDLSAGLFIPFIRSHGSHQMEHTRHLVSWAVCNSEGSVGLVNTLAEHQNKGYSKLVISHLCRQMLDKGRIPTADIDERQSAKLELFESLGFKKIYKYKWGFHVPTIAAELEKFTKFSTQLKRLDGRVFKPPPPSPVDEHKPSIHIQI